MTVTVSPSLELVFARLGNFIVGLFACEVVRGLGNGVPMPNGPFVAMTEINQNRLSTNVSAYNDPGSGIGTRNTNMANQFTIQIDVFGPDAQDWATAFVTLFRDQYGCDKLGPEVSPFYADDPVSAPVVNGEKNYEKRWIITAVMQCNQVVSVPQEFADVLKAGIVNVDATFH